MEPERHLPRSQVPAACTHRESDESSPTDLCKTYFNIMLPPTSGSYKWSISLRFPNPNLVCTSPFPHTCHLPAHVILLDFITRIIRVEGLILIYLLTAIGLTPGGSSTLHIYTEQHNETE
jgi:hypothetical protein